MQENDEVFNKLSQDPKELKSYKKPFTALIDLFTLPIRIVFYPLRRFLGKAIIDDASWGKRKENNELKALNNKSNDGKYNEISKDQYQVKRVDYKTSRNSNCSLILALNDNNSPNDRKLVINFHGNDVDAQNSEILAAALKDPNLKNDFIAIDYPRNANSTRELVDAGVSAVLRAINAGYKPENITITGHSFGGAWSALVLKEMKQYLKKGQKFEGYINHKSFTDIGAVAVAQSSGHHGDLLGSDQDKIQYQKDNKTFLSKTINFIGSLCGLQFNAKSALNDKNLPVKQMKFYAGNADTNVPSEASIAVSVETSNKMNIPTKIKYNDTSHFEYAKSLFKPSKDHKDWSKDKAAPNQKYTNRIFKRKDAAPGF